MKYFVWFALLYSNTAAAADCSLSLLDKMMSFYRDLAIQMDCPRCSNVQTKCDLDRIDKYPEVILVGESHDKHNSKKVREHLFSMAKLGQINLATEVDASGARLPCDCSGRYPLFKLDGGIFVSHAKVELLEVRNVKKPSRCGKKNRFLFL